MPLLKETIRRNKRRRSTEPDPVPAPKAKRSKGEERRKAREREAAALKQAAAPKRSYERFTTTRRGEHTALFLEYDARPPLVVVSKEARAAAAHESEARKRAKAGAAGRWGTRPAASTLPSPSRARQWRQGESGSEHGAHRDYSKEELVFWCDALESGAIKTTEIKMLYHANKIRVSLNMAARYVYGRRRKPSAAAELGEWIVEPGEWKKLRDGDDFKPIGRVDAALPSELVLFH